MTMPPPPHSARYDVLVFPCEEILFGKVDRANCKCNLASWNPVPRSEATVF